MRSRNCTIAGNNVATDMGIRMQPCDAGCKGTKIAPCTAMPWLKYTGLYSVPNLVSRVPVERRVNVKMPAGVMDSPHTPIFNCSPFSICSGLSLPASPGSITTSSHQGLLSPLDMCEISVGRPPKNVTMTCSGKYTSACRAVSAWRRAAICTSPRSTSHIVGVTTPVALLRGTRMTNFSKAHTA